MGIEWRLRAAPELADGRQTSGNCRRGTVPGGVIHSEEPKNETGFDQNRKLMPIIAIMLFSLTSSISEY